MFSRKLRARHRSKEAECLNDKAQTGAKPAVQRRCSTVVRFLGQAGIPGYPSVAVRMRLRYAR
jgi:hypothetical protein